MRNSTKLRRILENHSIEFNLNEDGNFEAIVTNIHNMSSTICVGTSFTDVMKEIMRDAKHLCGADT